MTEHEHSRLYVIFLTNKQTHTHTHTYIYHVQVYVYKLMLILGFLTPLSAIAIKMLSGKTQYHKTLKHLFTRNIAVTV